MSDQQFEDEGKYKKKFNSFKNKTATDADFNKVFDNEDSILFKAGKGKLLALKEDVLLLLEMVKAYFRGEYKEIPLGSISAIVFTLLYVFSPIDLIPDFILGIGLADDAAIVVLCLNFIKKDIDKFKQFKANKTELDGMTEGTV